MIHLIWLAMIVSGILVAGFNGNISVINQAVFEGAKSGVTISFGLISVLTLWLGLMKIAEEAGLLDALARLLRPLVRFLFPSVPAGHPAEGYILSNMAANLFGLGNAATPMGLAAMRELQKLNPEKDTATPAMCTLLALNTSGLTLVPTTIISVRMTYGSADATEIIGTTLVATLMSTMAAVLLDKWFQWRWRIRNGEAAKWRPPCHRFGVVHFLVASDHFTYGLVEASSRLRSVYGRGQGRFSDCRELIPHLVGMMVAVTVFRESGAMELLVRLLAPVGQLVGIPTEVLPLALYVPFPVPGRSPSHRTSSRRTAPILFSDGWHPLCLAAAIRHCTCWRCILARWVFAKAGMH